MASELLEDSKKISEQTPLLSEKAEIEAATEAATGEEWSKLKLLTMATVPPAFLFFIGVAALMYFEGWDVVIASYVITQMVTTIGYGDFTVQAQSAKLFMAFYALFVLVFLAYYYNLVVGRLVQWESAALRKYFRRLEVYYDDSVQHDEHAITKYGRINEAVAGLALFLIALAAGTIFFRLVEHCSCSKGVQGCDNSSYETCSATGGYVKGWTESFYMASVTLTTIGFGDYQPRTEIGRVFGMGWMLVGVATATLAILSISTLIFEEKKEKKFVSIDNDLSIDDETFAKIDRDGNGALSRAEYITYTLVKYDMVKAELLESIHQQFDKLDPDGTNSVTLSMIHDQKRKRLAQRGPMQRSQTFVL